MARAPFLAVLALLALFATALIGIVRADEAAVHDAQGVLDTAGNFGRTRSPLFSELRVILCLTSLAFVPLHFLCRFLFYSWVLLYSPSFSVSFACVLSSVLLFPFLFRGCAQNPTPLLRASDSRGSHEPF